MDQSRATCHDQRGDLWANHVGKKSRRAIANFFYRFETRRSVVESTQLSLAILSYNCLKFSQDSWITVIPNFYDSSEQGL